MPAIVMDGKALAANMREEVRRQVERMDRKPKLAVVRVGDDPASQVYAEGKKRDCRACGIFSEEYILPLQTSQQSLLDLLEVLGDDAETDGILVQFPLPEHLDGKAVELAIRPDKDVDCVNPVNMGHLLMGDRAFQPCTPAGVMRLLQEYRIDPAGKNCVVVGRSNIVGKPQAIMMMQRDATVTVCHTRTADLAAECRRADILITAAGQTGLICGEMIKPGAVVIDVAINRDGRGRLCGDVVYEEALERAAFLTPVPGGVGPVTRAILMENTLKAARRHGK